MSTATHSSGSAALFAAVYLLAATARQPLAAQAPPSDCATGALFSERNLGTAPRPACGERELFCLPLAVERADAVYLDGQLAAQTGCTADTLLAYDLAELSTVGLAGPFEVVWRVGESAVRARVDSLPELLGVLHANDPAGEWQVRELPAGASLAGGTPLGYGPLSLTDAETGLVRSAAPRRSPVRLGTAVWIDGGEHELVAVAGDCRDTLALKIACSEVTERSVTVIEGIRSTTCFAAADARPPAVRLLAGAGGSAQVDAVAVGGCVGITGELAGSASAEYEVCDPANGPCRRVRLAITVLPRSSVAPPQARHDVFAVALNGQRSVDVTANDLIAGGVTDVHVAGDTRGAVRVDEQFRVHYTAPADWCGEERVRYEVCSPGGCDTSSVLFEVICDDILVFNGLTPNGDGVNDVFTVLGLDNFDTHRLSIFDRRGRAIYGTDAYANDWIGEHDGRRLPQGTYYYVLEVGRREPIGGYLQLEY